MVGDISFSTFLLLRLPSKGRGATSPAPCQPLPPTRNRPFHQHHFRHAKPLTGQDGRSRCPAKNTRWQPDTIPRQSHAPSKPGSTDPFRNGTERLNVRLNDLSHLKTRPAVAARMDILHQMISHARLVEESVLKFTESLANPMIGEIGSLPDAFFQSMETLLFAMAEALQDS